VKPDGQALFAGTSTPTRVPSGTQVALLLQAGSAQSVLPLQSSSTPLKHCSAPVETQLGGTFWQVESQLVVFGGSQSSP
jgi:hypothetical protein